mgnify:CR=1 FL=1
MTLEEKYESLNEGINDPGIFKAVFMAGGPGSGKSYVAGKATGGTGLKSVNSDDAFEYLLKKAGLSLKMPEKETETLQEILEVNPNAKKKKKEAAIDPSLLIGEDKVPTAGYTYV